MENDKGVDLLRLQGLLPTELGGSFWGTREPFQWFLKAGTGHPATCQRQDPQEQKDMFWPSPMPAAPLSFLGHLQRQWSNDQEAQTLCP